MNTKQCCEVNNEQLSAVNSERSAMNNEQLSAVNSEQSAVNN